MTLFPTTRTQLCTELLRHLGADSGIDAFDSMRIFEAQLRDELGGRMRFYSELAAPQGRRLRCDPRAFVDLVTALFAWARAWVVANSERRPELRLKVGGDRQELEIAIWENGEGRPSVAVHALWSQLGEKIERLGGRMQIDAAGDRQGCWRRLWVDCADSACCDSSADARVRGF